ncbi:hypothetical protein TSUD_130460 [Trifolium subterraneum]|nr:hypothetical protein TSUD_130460 [Trifolium subterraneum]
MKDCNESYWGGGGGIEPQIDEEREEELEIIWKTAATHFRPDKYPAVTARNPDPDMCIGGDGATIYGKQKEIEDNKGTLKNGN